MEKYTVCLCGENCFSKKDVLEYCQVIDNDYYIMINDKLIPVNFDKYDHDSGDFFGYYKEYDCVIIYFENVLEFNDFMVKKKLFSKIDHHKITCNNFKFVTDYLRYITNHHKITCNNFKFVTDYLEYITKNNIINHIKYYLKNNYHNKIYWNTYLRQNIFKYSDVSTIRLCLKYLPVEYIDDYFFYSLSGNNNITLDYVVNKIGIYWTSFFTGKKYRGNMFKITNKDKLVEIRDIYDTLCGIIYCNKKNKKVLEIYCQAVNRFQELLESQENINVKKKLTSEHNKLKSKLTYNEKVKNRLLIYLLVNRNGKLPQIVKQLFIDGINIHTFNKEFGFELLDDFIENIITKKNLDLLDILFEIKLIDQTELNLIFKQSILSIDFENAAKLEIDENFIRELSGYGTDVDECFDELIKIAKYNNNKKFVGYLKNLKNDLM
ncbi:hypothetical protein QJ850_gp098 [Acanthamoeba polyphaga mimivirus]|uniref:Uncharacterized protein n=1 Tax=Acanthamoeba polyphaga mimivirus Kroon TaxID=3069720 RepID=A0A0G2YC32_9VIRU|nr:hypothetical protein QJ850_gp098 [Acanthamoeba polyphaga mimivirus]AKI80601.1 hypothetical protein [Acanthamoeba polyphaga mimivirus Kroon]